MAQSNSKMTEYMDTFRMGGGSVASGTHHKTQRQGFMNNYQSVPNAGSHYGNGMNTSHYPTKPQLSPLRGENNQFHRKANKSVYSNKEHFGRKTGSLTFKQVWRKAVEKYSPRKSQKLNEVSLRFQAKLDQINKSLEKKGEAEESGDDKDYANDQEETTNLGIPKDEDKIKFVSIID